MLREETSRQVVRCLLAQGINRAAVTVEPTVLRVTVCSTLPAMSSSRSMPIAMRRTRRVRRAVTLVVAAVCALVVLAPAAGASTCTVPTKLWDQPVNAGSVANANIGGEVHLVTGSVTAVCNSATAVATITGTISLANDATKINVTINYKDDRNWTLTIAAGAVPSDYKPRNWAGIDLRNLSGTIVNTNGTVMVALKASNYVMGSQIMDLTVVIDPDNKVWAGSATLSNTHIGGVTVNQVTIATTSTGNTAYLSGNLTTEGGTFAASIAATGINSADAPAGNPFKWALAITLSASNLNGSVSTVRFNQFSASAAVAATDATSCIDITFSTKATWVLQGVERSINDFSFIIHCQKLKNFNFSMSVGHDVPNGGYVKGTLSMRWISPGTNAVVVTLPWNDSFTIYGGLYGGVDLEYLRDFSHSYKDSWGQNQTFSRSVTVGIGLSTGLVQWSPGQSTFSPFVEVGGWLTADRVAGNVYCDWLSSNEDFSCYASLRWNPEDAGGPWYYDWSGM